MNSHTLRVKRLATQSVLIALSLGGRLAFQFIPNVQPMTVIFILISLNFSLGDGIIVAAGSVFLSNILLGMGPWTFYQIATYILILVLFSLFKPFYKKSRLNSLVFSMLAFLAGLLYGFIISIFSYYIYGLSNFWVYYLQGLSFDLLHALGNLGFFLILEPTLGSLLRRQVKNIYRKP